MTICRVCPSVFNFDSSIHTFNRVQRTLLQIIHTISFSDLSNHSGRMAIPHLKIRYWIPPYSESATSSRHTPSSQLPCASHLSTPSAKTHRFNQQFTSRASPLAGHLTLEFKGSSLMKETASSIGIWVASWATPGDGRHMGLKSVVCKAQQ